MNLQEIKNALGDSFNKELSEGRKRHIVFWYDEDGEFSEHIDKINLGNVRLLKLNENNSFAIKYEIEGIDTSSNFLVYANMPKPAPSQNWLLDIVKYSTEFTTDKAMAIMAKLGVKNHDLKGVFQKYEKFFNSKERLDIFANYKINDYSEEKVDIAVLSTLCKLDTNDFDGVLKALFIEELCESNKYMEAIKKFGDLKVLWILAEKYYGFILEEKSLEGLLIYLIITNLSYTLEEEVPKCFRGYVLDKKEDSFVFINHFMNHSTDSKVYDDLATSIESKLNILEYIKEWDIDNYLKCDTFKAFDVEIISKLVLQLLSDIEDYPRYKNIILQRRRLHWFKNFQDEYEAISTAIELFETKKKLDEVINQNNSYEFTDKYFNEYYVADRAYRDFCGAFPRLEDKETLIPLREKVENIYIDCNISEFSTKYTNDIKEELKEKMGISGVNLQKDIKKVEVKLINISRKISNITTYLDFLQTEKLEYKKIPLRLKLYFEDEEGNKISSESTIIADSESLNPQERIYKEKFTFKNSNYDKTKKYYLILKEDEKKIENIYGKIPFNIDIANI